MKWPILIAGSLLMAPIFAQAQAQDEILKIQDKLASVCEAEITKFCPHDNEGEALIKCAARQAKDIKKECFQYFGLKGNALPKPNGNNQMCMDEFNKHCGEKDVSPNCFNQKKHLFPSVCHKFLAAGFRNKVIMNSLRNCMGEVEKMCERPPGLTSTDPKVYAPAQKKYNECVKNNLFKRTSKKCQASFNLDPKMMKEYQELVKIQQEESRKKSKN